ncbi:MAG: MEDS domain-containing protein, partial [Solirubrobacteraceae bacterium]
MAGIVPGDHVCASYGSDAEHQALVGRYARAALRRGERFLYLAHSSGEATIRAYLEEEGIDVVAGRWIGQIVIRHVQHGRDRIDPEAIVATLQADRRAALRDGYRALCGA